MPAKSVKLPQQALEHMDERALAHLPRHIAPESPPVPEPVVIHTGALIGSQTFIGGGGSNDTIIFDVVSTRTGTGEISIGLDTSLMWPPPGSATYANVMESQLAGSTIESFENVTVLQSVADFTNVTGDAQANRLEVHSTGHSSLILGWGGDDHIFAFADAEFRSTFIDAGFGDDYLETFAVANAIAVIEEDPAINGLGTLETTSTSFLAREFTTSISVERTVVRI